ncbi:unnamed protein product [Rotaria sp. Silwood1]|nr:unnamed protein product [Rotaria sp. Silwood1]
MSRILLFHFVLLIISISLLIFGISTPRWLIYLNENTTGTINEYSKGILIICHRFYRSYNVDQYSIMNNLTNNNNYIYNNIYICFNRLYKWYNSSISGPELLSVLTLIILALFFGFEHLQNMINYGSSFWSFLTGTCLTIRQGDISKEICDAIVNPTRVSMHPNGGLDTIMHNVMGKLFADQVNAVSQEMQENACPVGQSRIFVAKTRQNPNVARFVINTVGPVYHLEEKEKAAFLLQSCYSTSLQLSNLYSLTSIAYPAISCGANHFPSQEAAQVAIESVRQYSCNVNDVRFVLYERPIYDAFVKEWTDYAEKINQAATTTTTTTIDERSRFRIASRSSFDSIRDCILCNEQQLPADRKHLCIKCSELTRSMIFDRFLQRLCIAAETSLDELEKACKLLKPILDYYPLIYTPIQRFDQSIHKPDAAAEYFVQNHCDKQFRNSMPVAIVGDGNCFYNTFLKLSGAGATTEASAVTPVELRARNVVELVLHKNEYTTKYESLEMILDSFEDYVRKEMVHDTHFTSIWDLLSIPTVLDIDVISVYPKVNGDEDINYETLNGKRFSPLISKQTINDKQSKITKLTAVSDRKDRIIDGHKLGGNIIILANSEKDGHNKLCELIEVLLIKAQH